MGLTDTVASRPNTGDGVDPWAFEPLLDLVNRFEEAGLTEQVGLDSLGFDADTRELLGLDDIEEILNQMDEERSERDSE